MLNFLKRNVKFVVTIGISVLVIAGLSTTLILTNVASASDRGRERRHDRDRSSVRMELTEEQLAEREQIRQERAEQRVAKVREKLEQRLADGEITQEEFDEKIAALESGECPLDGKSKRSGGGSRGNKGNKEKTPSDVD